MTNIDVFEKVNFKQLKELYLRNNEISDIKVFKKAKFDKLEILDLSNNDIDEVDNSEITLYLKSKIKNLYVF